MSCPRSWEVRAVDEGRLAAADVAAFERHLRGCASCRSEVSSLRALHDLARELPQELPTELDLRRLRARVLRDTLAPATQRTPRLVAAAAGACAIVALIVATKLARTPHPGGGFTASVTASPAASWTQSREGAIERVVLLEGDATLRVHKQGVGERFLVVVPDGEIEVRGTTFEVSVRSGSTSRVHVDEGVVVVRVRGERTLQVGDTWPRDEESASAPAAPVAPPAPPPPPVTPSGAEAAHEQMAVTPSSVSRPNVARQPSVPASGSVSPTSAAPTAARDEASDYERAVDAYRLGRFEQAASLLHDLAITYPSSPLLDDALFIEATSQASAGHSDTAARLAAEHAARFPASFHRKEAALLIARRLRDEGDCAGARRALSMWLDDVPQDLKVRAALGGCAGS
jgi:TolA-binding protein